MQATPPVRRSQRAPTTSERSNDGYAAEGAKGPLTWPPKRSEGAHTGRDTTCTCRDGRAVGFLRKWFGVETHTSAAALPAAEARRRVEMITAGNAAEAVAADWASARPMLRLCTVREELAPPGDVSLPGLGPGLVDIVALDAGPSVRYLSKSLLASWDVGLEPLVQAAREAIRGLPLQRDDRGRGGHPGFRSLSCADGSPIGGALVADLDTIEPAAVGMFGTIIGLPTADGFFYRALDDGEDLRADLAMVAFFTHKLFSESPPPQRLLQSPFWRCRDGSVVEVAFSFSEDPVAVSGSVVPAFEGVLTALDPRTGLRLPGWATGVLSGSAYTRFAGCVSATLNCPPAEVAERGGGLRLAEAAAIVANLPLDEWPLVLEHFLRDTARTPLIDLGGAAVGARRARTAAAAEDEDQGAAEAAARMPWLAALRDAQNDARLKAILSEPGLSDSEAGGLLATIRIAVEGQVRGGAILPELTPRALVDLAQACKGNQSEAWPAIVSRELSRVGDEATELDRLAAGPYEDASPSLWAQLHPQPWTPPEGSGLATVQDEVLPGLFGHLLIHSPGRRTRRVFRHMLDAWGVDADRAWVDATNNLLARTPMIEPWPDASSPLRLIHSPDREAEWLGLLLHRRPDACPAGQVVALPFRSSAIYLPLDAPNLLAALPVFARLAAGAYREASQFDDQLYRNLLWLQPDGTPVVLFDLFKVPERPTDLPAVFLAAAGSAHRLAPFDGRPS